MFLMTMLALCSVICQLALIYCGRVKKIVDDGTENNSLMKKYRYFNIYSFCRHDWKSVVNECTNALRRDPIIRVIDT